jgi:hypothetical protein
MVQRRGQGQPRYDEHPTEKRLYKVDECVSVDDNGPVNPVSILGDIYRILFKKIRTGLRTVSKKAITSNSL